MIQRNVANVPASLEDDLNRMISESETESNCEVGDNAFHDIEQFE